MGVPELNINCAFLLQGIRVPGNLGAFLYAALIEADEAKTAMRHQWRSLATRVARRCQPKSSFTCSDHALPASSSVADGALLCPPLLVAVVVAVAVGSSSCSW